MNKQLLSLCIVIGTMEFTQSTDVPRFGLEYKLTPNLGINARYIAGVTDIVKNGETLKILIPS